ncbi:hypothetical protein GCM10027416_10240 [Okibacterium endophyticum]
MSESENRTPLRIVSVNGSLHAPSKTGALLEGILDQLERAHPIDAHRIDVSEIGPAFAGALRRDQLPDSVEHELRQIEQADLLVVGTPVYRASFTGLFKHLFDFVGQYELVDKPVLLAATGGGERHALILEHQFRPLFGFFQALTLPLGVYASASDFNGYTIGSETLARRIDLAVQRGLPIALSGRARRDVEVSSYVGAW